MKIPQMAKPYLQILSEIAPKRFGQVLQHASDLWLHDKYLHWNELRRRPTAHNLSHEESWLLLKLGRTGKLKPVPLNDKNSNAFKFTLPDQLIEQLHGIDRGLGSTFHLPEEVTNPETRNQYVVSSLIQESITSSQLEGAATTREVAKEMLRSGRQPRDKSEKMILNNYRTMQRIMDLRSAALTPELVFELHGRVTEGTMDKADGMGRFRRADERISVMDIEGNIFHDPPKAEELTKRMEAMCDFANARTPDYFIHPVIRAIILHFWLAYDHPFIDGNGRTARALFYWCMLHQGFRLFEFISISQIILQAPAQYAQAFLHTETDDNDLTYFILHQTEVIKRAVESLHSYIAHKASEFHETEKCLRGIVGLNHRQQVLLTHAFRHPRANYSIEGHRHSQGVVYQTARTDLLDLTNRGLLIMDRLGRAMVFRVPHDLSQKLSKISDIEAKSVAQDTTMLLPLIPQNKREK